MLCSCYLVFNMKCLKYIVWNDRHDSDVSDVPRTELYCANNVTTFPAVGFVLISFQVLCTTLRISRIHCHLHSSPPSIHSSSHTSDMSASALYAQIECGKFVTTICHNHHNGAWENLYPEIVCVFIVYQYHVIFSLYLKPFQINIAFLSFYLQPSSYILGFYLQHRPYIPALCDCLSVCIRAQTVDRRNLQFCIVF